MGVTNTDKGVWRYFRQGDIVRCEYVWGRTLFEVHGFHGNEYCPLLTVYMLGKPRDTAHMCNFDVRKTKLIAASQRPLKGVPSRVQLLKMMAAGNIDARRELMIRLNAKI